VSEFRKHFDDRFFRNPESDRVGVDRGFVDLAESTIATEIKEIKSSNLILKTDNLRRLAG
jgi:hypothetical protein